MFRSRPIQYLGLFLLLVISLLVIFFPVGSKPKEQTYTVYLTSPKPFADLVDKKTTPVEAADKALGEQFKTERLPGALTIAPDDTKSATVQDFATTREEARDRSQRIVQALSKPLKGVTMGQQTEKEFEGFPVKPLFTFGTYAVFPVHQGEKGPVPAIKLGLDLQGGVNLVLQIRRALYAYEAEKPLPQRVEDRDKLVTDIRDALANVQGADLKLADVVIRPGSDNVIEVRTQAKDRAEFNKEKAALDVALKSVGGVTFAPAGDPQFFDPAGEKKDSWQPNVTIADSATNRGNRARPCG